MATRSTGRSFSPVLRRTADELGIGEGVEPVGDTALAREEGEGWEGEERVRHDGHQAIAAPPRKPSFPQNLPS